MHKIYCTFFILLFFFGCEKKKVELDNTTTVEKQQSIISVDDGLQIGIPKGASPINTKEEAPKPDTKVLEE